MCMLIPGYLELLPGPWDEAVHVHVNAECMMNAVHVHFYLLTETLCLVLLHLLQGLPSPLVPFVRLPQEVKCSHLQVWPYFVI